MGWEPYRKIALQRKVRALSCGVNERRFTVVRVNSDPSDVHAGRSFQQAMAAAQPDRGAKIEVFVVCAKDAGFARLKHNRGVVTRNFYYKGR